MSIVLVLLIMIAAVAWVVTPLFRNPSTAVRSAAEASASSGELLYRKQVAAGIINDLHFDLQTGKLSSEDHAALVAEQKKLIADIDARLEAGPARTKSQKKSTARGLTAGLLLLLMTPAIPASAREVLFSGRLLDGSRDSTGVANSAVALQLLRDDGHPRARSIPNAPAPAALSPSESPPQTPAQSIWPWSNTRVCAITATRPPSRGLKWRAMTSSASTPPGAAARSSC